MEDSDDSVAHAVKWEVMTCLSVFGIIGEIEPMTWEMKARSNV